MSYFKLVIAADRNVWIILFAIKVPFNEARTIEMNLIYTKLIGDSFEICYLCTIYNNFHFIVEKNN